jgi:uncharacterized membrane protein YkgB
MMHTKFLRPRATGGRIRTPDAKSLSSPAVTAEKVGRTVAVAGQLLARYGLVAVLAWIGVGHIAKPAAIHPLITHSPLLSWLYGIFSVEALGYALGSAELLAALLIALWPLWPRVSAIGSVFALLLFCSTISFLFTTPGVASGGVLSLLGQFLFKDVALLGVSLWTLGDSFGFRQFRPPSSRS